MLLFKSGGSMKIIVIYSSETGNTKSVAQAIYEEFKPDAIIIPMCDAKNYNLNEFDYVFIGFWVDKGYPSEEACVLLKNITNCRIALFATLGAYPYSMQTSRVFYRAGEMIDESNRVLGSFMCQGRIPKEKLDEINSRPPDHPRYPTPIQTLARNIGQLHPNEEDFLAAKKLFRTMVERTYDIK